MTMISNRTIISLILLSLAPNIHPSTPSPSSGTPLACSVFGNPLIGIGGEAGGESIVCCIPGVEGTADGLVPT